MKLSLRALVASVLVTAFFAVGIVGCGKKEEPRPDKTPESSESRREKKGE